MSRKSPPNNPPTSERERIAKVIARAGLASRREAETWIAEGRVKVNGEVLKTPAVTVSAPDKIEVDGKPLPVRERTRLFLYNKPKGLVTTNSDPEGRPTIFQNLPPDLPRLVSVGRLDINSEGLLLLTNDGGLSRTLELPATGWLRRYRVRANGRTDQAALNKLKGGVTVEGVQYGRVEATLDREQGANLWLTVGIREGKNREVRKVLAHIGLKVNRLIRISFGPFQLGELEPGKVEEVPTRVLREQIGGELEKSSHSDFDAPLRERAKISPVKKEKFTGNPDRNPTRRDGKKEAASGDRKKKNFSVERKTREEAPREPRRKSKRPFRAPMRKDKPRGKR